MTDFIPSQPEKEQVSLHVVGSGFAGAAVDVEVKNFTEYSFSSHFLNATDGWTFTIGAERLTEEEQQALKPGNLVRLKLNGGVQSTGYIDSIEISASRGSGSVWRIEGRDKLGQAVDACADPTKQFKKDQTLESALIELFAPFGWSGPDHFTASNVANAELQSQKFRSKANTPVPERQGGGRRGRRPHGSRRRPRPRQASDRIRARGFGPGALREYKLLQYRPKPGEGVFEFASRMAQRFGLWIWLSADGEQLIVSDPDFEQEPTYELRRNLEGTTNVLDGSVKFDMSQQPTHIIADGVSGGGEFGRSKIIAYAFNNIALFRPAAGDTELGGKGSEEATAALLKYARAGGKLVDSPTFDPSAILSVPRARVLYLHDEASRSQEHLEAFVRRELALLQRKSLTVNYTVEGHGQITPDGFRPWTVDTVVQVDDDVAGLHEKLYVLGRTFNKSRSSGTTTHLELIRLNTLVFTDLGK